MRREMTAVKPNENIFKNVRDALMGANTLKFIGEALPPGVRQHLAPARMARIAFTAFQRTPLLWSCSPSSIVRSVIDASSVGLEPVGGPLAHGYLVPYKNECVFQIGYQGFIEIARRSGEFKGIEANPVYANDKLTLRYGFQADFCHEPTLCGPRGEIIGAYCMVSLLQSSDRIVTWMPKEDIDKRREASKNQRDDGPWNQWYDEMALKTVIRKAAKLWPKTPEFSQAMAIDDGASSDAAIQFMDAELGADESIRPTASAEPPPRKPSTDRLLAKMQAPQGDEPPSIEEDDEPWKKHQKESEDEDDADND